MDLNENTKCKKTELKDYEDFCDHCGNYGKGIEYFDSKNYHSICYKCIDKIRKDKNGKRGIC